MYSLVQEMLDSIDEVWRCQGPKVEFSCLFLRPRLSEGNFPGATRHPLHLQIHHTQHITAGRSSLHPSVPPIFHGLMKTFLPYLHRSYRSTPWPVPDKTPFARTRRAGENSIISFIITVASCPNKRDAGAKYRFRATARSPGSSGS